MSTNDSSTAIMSWCPVHGTAACPEGYMLNRDGEPWAHYVDHWDESMRCDQRLHAVPVQWEWADENSPLLYHPEDGELPDDPSDFPLFTLRRLGSGSDGVSR